MSAHYAGLCKNLGLVSNLQAIYWGTAGRRPERRDLLLRVKKIRQEADGELRDRGWETSIEGDAIFKIQLEIGTIQVNLSQEAISLMRSLGSGILMKELSEMTRKDTLKLTDWYSKMSTEYSDVVDIAVDRSGFLVKTEGMRFLNTDEREIA